MLLCSRRCFRPVRKERRCKSVILSFGFNLGSAWNILSPQAKYLVSFLAAISSLWITGAAFLRPGKAWGKFGSFA